MLKNKNGNVRSIDIANEMNFSKPSISNAMKLFRESGYIIMDENGHINLTETGLEIAEQVYERHRLLTKWLVLLGVNEKTAREDACRIEHAISDETFDKIKIHVNNVHNINI